MDKASLDMVYTRPTPQTYVYFLDGDIGEPSDYRELLHVLDMMGEEDVLRLNINCFGGYLHTTTMIANAIRTTRGTVRGILNGNAMSGGSIIFLSCHAHEVMVHSRLMAHTSIGGEYGKLSDTTRSIESSAKQLKALYQDVYYGFFTPEEIDLILDGKDDYIHYDEIVERLHKRADIIKADAMNRLDEESKEYEIPDAILKKLTATQMREILSGKKDFDLDWNLVDTEDLE